MIKEKTKTAPLRLKISEVKDLKKEAKGQFRTLASYLRMLIITHPDRNKK